MRNFRFILLSALSLLAPTFASAHEVYVLSRETVERAMATESPNPFSAYAGNEFHFYFWGFVSFAVVSAILFASLYRVLEAPLAPILARLKRYAHIVVRFTVGLSFISFAYAGELYGHELLFTDLFGSMSAIAQLSMFVIGACITLGLWTRAAAFLAILTYAYAWFVHGYYLLTYTDHLGAALLLFVLGSGSWSIDSLAQLGRLPKALKHVLRACAPLAFPLLRILFGFGIMFASVYAKFIHSELALQVVHQYHLTTYFPFDPLFIVLGALIIEFIAGLFLVIGFEIRWTGLFLLFWLTLSLLYFQEAVWPHLILFGGGIAIFLHGYDRFSLEGRFLKRGALEPVL